MLFYKLVYCILGKTVVEDLDVAEDEVETNGMFQVVTIVEVVLF